MAGLHVFLYAFILTLGLILPLGPQNSFILSIGAHTKRFSQTLPAVITASLCDALLIFLAVIGVSVAVAEIVWLKLTLTIAGSLFLFYFAWRSMRAKPDTDLNRVLIPASISKQIILAATFSIMNPFAWLDTMMVIGTTAATFNGKDRIIFTVTSILVSCLWFLFLARVGQKIDEKLKDAPWKGRVIAVIFFTSALFLLYRGLL
jgi:L-lysine exporter family protein LysE/ArgO